MQRLGPFLLCAALGACADVAEPSLEPKRAPRAQQTLDGGVTYADAASLEDSGDDAAASLLDAALAPVDAGTLPTPSTDEDPCADVTSAADDGALHAEVAALLTPQSPCGFSACHAGSRAKAGLRLSGINDLRAQLVDKPACEAPSLPLIDGAGGAEALARSWLWQKLAAPADASGALLPQPSWGASEACGQTPAEPFGMLMPLAAGSLASDDLSVVRRWICAGAPGPSEASVAPSVP